MQEIKEIIRHRYSSREYIPQRINEKTKKELLDYIENESTDFNGELLKIQLIEKPLDSSIKMRLDYGMVRGHHTYLVGTTNNKQLARVKYGYIMEKIVLKATSLGLNSCWIGYFDRTYFNDIHFTDDMIVPSIVILGYAKEKKSLRENFLRMAVASKTRKSWEQLFFEQSMQTPLLDTDHIYLNQAFEMLRLAPSSGNTQPWRIFFDKDTTTAHFYKKPSSKRYETDGLHDIDMGIAISHFDLSLKESGITGSWKVLPDFNKDPQLQYIISWQSSS